MSIKRFFAKTSREALRMVRDALGPDGVIVSNRGIDGGIEILALGATDIAALTPPPANGKAKDASILNSAMQETERSEQAKAMVRRNEENLAERRISAATNGKDVSGIHFSAFDGKREQRMEQWANPHLPIESHQAKSPMLQGLETMQEAPADSSDECTNPQPAMRSRKSAEPPVDRQANQPEPAEDSISPKSAAREKKLPAAIKPRKRNSPIDRVAQVAQVGGVALATARKQRSEQHTAFNSRQIAEEVAANVLDEIRSMRSNLEGQFAALAWNEQQRRDPIRGRVLRQLLAAGFSASLANDLLERLPLEQPAGQSVGQPKAQEGRQEEKREKDAMNWIRNVLANNLRTIANENEILENGGVYALVGPTGVGKTTTTAKLAARCVVRHGSDKLALLTTDGYRIGGHEQLRIYGKILGVTVCAVKDTQDLTLALAELRGKHMVLIDTVGMGQRDKMVTEQVAMLAGCGAGIKRLLLLNAASSGDTLNEVVHAYQGDGLAGAIITKLDEAVTAGCSLDTVIRHQLPLYYIAAGQRVPEDLHLADAGYLVNSAFNNLPAASPFAVPEHVLPLLMAGLRKGAVNPDSNEVRFG